MHTRADTWLTWQSTIARRGSSGAGVRKGSGLNPHCGRSLQDDLHPAVLSADWEWVAQRLSTFTGTQPDMDINLISHLHTPTHTHTRAHFRITPSTMCVSREAERKNKGNGQPELQSAFITTQRRWIMLFEVQISISTCMLLVILSILQLLFKEQKDV